MFTPEFKSFQITEYKSDNAGNLIIQAYGAIFNNVDSGKDLIRPGSFEQTLVDMAGRIAFCYQHDIFNPVGKILDIHEDQTGLFLKVMLSAAEDDIQIKIKEKILQELSIGYVTEDSHPETIDGEQVRVITKIKLYEVSLVTLAMNELARIQDMKSNDKVSLITKEFDRLIAVVRNENIKFEISKLKPIVLSALAKSDPEPPKEQLKAADYLSLLTAGKN